MPPYIGDLFDINSTVLDSNIIGIMGPSGCGKSFLTEEIIEKIKDRNPYGKMDVCYRKVPSQAAPTIVRDQFRKNVKALLRAYRNEEDHIESQSLILVIDDYHLASSMESLLLSDDELLGGHTYLIVMSQPNNIYMRHLVTGSYCKSFMVELCDDYQISMTVDGLILPDDRLQLFQSQCDEEEEEQEEQEEKEEEEHEEEEQLWDNAMSCAMKLFFPFREERQLTCTPEEIPKKVTLRKPKELSHEDRKRLRMKNASRLPSFVGLVNGGDSKTELSTAIAIPIRSKSLSTPVGSDFFRDFPRSCDIPSQGLCVADISDAWWI